MADMVSIPLEEYVRLRVEAEENSRFFEWDISCNWSDYDNALYSTRHDNGEDEITIDDWEAKLRKELSEIDLTDTKAVWHAGR